MVTTPDRFAAVGVRLDFDVHRHEGRWAVVLRPVELHPAGNPRAGQANQGGLYHVLAVKEVVAVGLVPTDVDAPADLREDHHAEEIVFEDDGVPLARGGLVGDAIKERQRVNRAAAALVDPFFQKHRVFIGGQRLEGGQRNGFTTDDDSGGWHGVHSMPDLGMLVNGGCSDRAGLSYG